MLVTCFLALLTLRQGNESSAFLRNVDELLSDYTLSQPNNVGGFSINS